jgi:predicted MFS family arabinose efflux permease
VLLGAFGAGGVVGAVVAGRVDGPARWRQMLTVALLLVGVMLAALGLAPTFAVAVVLSLFCGAGMVVGEVLSETALPRMLGGDVLGRAYGLVLPASLGGIVAGSLIAGPLVSLLGLRGALALAGLSVLVSAALLLRRPLVAPGRPAPAAVPAAR